jgi:putative endonuclease
MTTRGDKKSTVQSGRRGEDRAVSFLTGRGYAIVERNFRCKLGELDIIARDGADTLVFVEVRTRATADRGTALETVRAAKQAKVARVAAQYLAVRRPKFVHCRFDVLAITGDDVVLIKDAFRLG